MVGMTLEPVCPSRGAVMNQSKQGRDRRCAADEHIIYKATCVRDRHLQGEVLFNARVVPNACCQPEVADVLLAVQEGYQL